MAGPSFYFDFLSPYSYLAWMQLGERRGEFEMVPVVFGAILDSHGTLGPAEIPAKRRFLIRDCLRAADRLGVPFSFPATHPFLPIKALRLTLAEVAGDRQLDVIGALWKAGWQDGGDLADDSVLSAAMDAIGLDGGAQLAKTRDDSVKRALRDNTERAVADGVFGVPSFKVGDDIIWGSDRTTDVFALVDGQAPVDSERIARAEATPTGIVRNKAKVSKAEERVRYIFGAAPFMTALGVELHDVAEGQVHTTLDIRDDHLQQDGFVHAGVVASLADHSAGAAAGSIMPDGKSPLTVEYKINMLRPALGPRLRCEAKVLKGGRTICVSEAEVYDVRADVEKLVAKATVTLAVVDQPGS